jgi:hypothetical protein
VLDAIGLQTRHLRRALKRTDQALDAVTGEGKADHATRLKAAEQLYGLVGLKAHTKPPDSSDPTRPVQVAIILSQPSNGHARALPDADGVRIHLGGGNGSGT